MRQFQWLAARCRSKMSTLLSPLKSPKQSAICTCPSSVVTAIALPLGSDRPGRLQAQRGCAECLGLEGDRRQRAGAGCARLCAERERAERDLAGRVVNRRPDRRDRAARAAQERAEVGRS